ncbi:MAG: CBS domain-containing protein [Gammaproteobacteria bacterium]|nr:CBS domain-containing protein [Gammaproteobacteria bacterium]
MDISEISKFLAQTTPFNQLPAFELARLSQRFTVYYYQAQELVPAETNRLLIVRTGVFSLYSDQQQLLAKLQEGDFYGYQRLLTELGDQDQLRCEEDGLVYWLDSTTFDELRYQFKNFDIFFQRLFSRRLHQYREQQQNSRFTLKIDDLIHRRKVTIAPEQSVQTAAALMTEQRVSSLLVEEHNKLVGIVTDRDLRSRVLAKDLPASTQVCQIMTRQPHHIDRHAYLFEAVQLMSRHNIHHLPVTEQGNGIGMITATDIIRAQQDHPVYLIGQIHRQQNVDGLEQCSLHISELAIVLGKQQVPAAEASHILTTITDALTQRLVQLAQEQLGKAPCVFSWLAFGSQARMDQSLNADQDNALLLEKEPVGEIGDYFQALAEFVCLGLARCGVKLCPGNIMATNPELRLSLRGWSSRFARWISTPTPAALLNASIYFDLRVIEGSRGLCNALQQDILARTVDNSLFLLHLAHTALERTAPLGLFKNFILEQDGQHKKGLDLKKRGISLLTDIVRVYALSAGITQINTRSRLQELDKLQIIEAKQVQNLLDAFDVLSLLRFEKHVHELQQDHDVTNLLDPAMLSSLQRHQLKDCFNVIHAAQQSLRYRFCRE